MVARARVSRWSFALTTMWLPSLTMQRKLCLLAATSSFDALPTEARGDSVNLAWDSAFCDDVFGALGDP